MQGAFFTLRVCSGVIAITFVTPAVPLVADPGGIGSARFDVVETTIPTIQKALQPRLITAEQLVQMYLDRISAYDSAGPRLNSYIHVNANALAEARLNDAARHRGNIKSPMYGVPIILKDNVDTADMPTTAGSVALTGSIPLTDALITRKLRDAGAIIL